MNMEKLLERNMSILVETAMEGLIEGGFTVTIRREKTIYKAECHNYNYSEYIDEAVYGLGKTWKLAVIDAFKEWKKG